MIAGGMVSIPMNARTQRLGHTMSSGIPETRFKIITDSLRIPVIPTPTHGIISLRITLNCNPHSRFPRTGGNLEGVNQIYNQRPGTSDFPQWIYNMSGVEPAYAGLVPTNEWHWQYISPSEIVNPIGSNWILPWILLIGTLVLIGIGLFLIVRTHGKDLVDRKPEEIISDDVGGDK